MRLSPGQQQLPVAITAGPIRPNVAPARMSLVYILRPRGYRPQQGQFRLAVGGETTQQVLFREIRMWEQEPQTWWEEAPGLMALYPLCRIHDRPRAVVSHAAGVIRERATDTIVRADLLTTLYIFGKLVFPGADLLGMIGREQMRESKAYEEIMALGRCEAKQEAVLEALSTRFGTERAEEFRVAIAGLEDLQRLTHLHRLAVGCSRLDEFRKAFERN
jgi:hypothetical protein